MKRQRFPRSVIIGVPALIALWFLLFPVWIWRYQMTLEVETPEGLKTGASVVEVRVSFPRVLRGGGLGPETTVRGQAVSVDLGARGIFFGVLSRENNPDYIYRVVYDVFHIAPYDRVDRTFDNYSSLRAKADLPPAKLPRLVRFRDIAVPATIEEIAPDDLAKAFGPGVKLVRATIEMVDSGYWPFNAFDIGGPAAIMGVPITTGIEKKLVWLDGFYGKRLDGNPLGSSDASNKLANSLSSGSFGYRR